MIVAKREKGSGRTKIAKNFSFNCSFANFNESSQADYCSVREFSRSPVSSDVDFATEVSATDLTTSRKANEKMKELQFLWIHIQGPE